MRKGRRKTNTAASEKPDHPEIRLGAHLQQATYFRLCHHCLHLNESVAEIIRCEHCRRPLTFDPTLQYLDGESDGEHDEIDLEEMDISADEEFFAPDGENDLAMDRRLRLAGLSVLW
jgi:hypothetical protein